MRVQRIGAISTFGHGEGGAEYIKPLKYSILKLYVLGFWRGATAKFGVLASMVPRPLNIIE